MTDGRNAPGPLAGLRVVEFDAIGPVPLAAMILADMGADVLRIARPGAGSGVGELGARILHRGRRAVPLDLKAGEGRAAALALAARAEIVLEGLRPGTMERLGLGPEACLAANPALVYGRMTGWGQDGPLARTAGHDLTYIAITGALHAMGAADRPPAPPLNLVGDYGGGAMLLLAGVLAALTHARATGTGQVVDAAMTEGTHQLLALFHGLRQEGQWSAAREVNLLDGGRPWYRCYPCADGGFVAVGALEPPFFAALLAGLGLDPALYRQEDPATWAPMERAFAAAFATRGRDDWAAQFAATDACVAPVLTLGEAPFHPQTAARAGFAEREGTLHPAPAPRFSATPSAIRPAGTIGAAEALARWGGAAGAAQPAAG